MNNKLKKSISVLGLALVLATPIFATEPVKYSTETAAQAEIKSKPVKVMQFKPVLKNGTLYVSLQDLESKFGAKISEPFKNYYNITTPVSRLYLSTVSEISKVNGAESHSNGKLETINNMLYAPAEFIFQNSNCTSNYTKTTNTLTVNYMGIPSEFTVNSTVNSIKGRVLYPDGTPVEGAKVTLNGLTREGAFIGVSNEQTSSEKYLMPPVTYTDPNGYYETLPLDVKAYPYVQVNIEKEINKNGKSTILCNTTPSTFDYQSGDLLDGFLRLDSRLVSMPTVTIFE